MTLTLTIRNVERLENGSPTEFVLNRRGAMIGRAGTCDWSLPDPRSFISSRHAEVTFRDGFYFLNDISTNGTFLNGAGERMAEPRRIEQNDLFLIGHYEMLAALSGAAVAAVEREEEQAAAAADQAGGFSWDAGGPAAPAPAPDRGGWGDAPANSGLASGAGGMSMDGGWSAGSGGGTDDGWGPAPAGGGGDWVGASPAASGGWDAAPAPVAQGGNDGWGPAPSAPGGGNDWEPTPTGGDGRGWGPAPTPTPDSGSWAAPSAPTPGGNASWMPEARPSLSSPTPYAQRGGGGGMAPLPPAGPTDSGNSWAPARQQAEERAPSPWDSAQAPVQQASAWSSPVSDRPAAKSPNDIWGSMEGANVVDWGRAFGEKPAEAKDMLGLGRQASDSLPKQLPPQQMPPGPAADEWASAPPAPPMAAPSQPVSPQQMQAPSAPPSPAPVPPRPQAAPPPPPHAAPAAAPPAPLAADAGQMVALFATAAGLRPEQLKQANAETLDRAGRIMKKLVSGLVVMVEARARAKSQMGAEQTGLEFDGNNPIKFARAPDQALAQLLNPPERGFMPSEKAIEDAFFDLQSHQMATLKAMQGALRATLDRFSPAAIKKRAETGGFMQRLLPGGREATLWQTYEREFSGVSEGSAEAFMDVFAKEFRQAYDELARNRKRG